jgi:hypothetical protein
MPDAMAGNEEVRAALRDYILQQARWRTEKASEHGGDRRNVTSAEALHDLADYVSRLDESDSRLRRLVGLRDVLVPAGVFMPGKNAVQMISRFGFDRDMSEWSPERAGEFLDALVEVCQQEANHERLESLSAAATTDAALEALDEMDRAEEVDEGAS